MNTFRCVAGHIQRLRLQQALFHLSCLHHCAGEGHWQPSAVVPALSQGFPRGGQAVCEQRLPRPSEPHWEGGPAQFHRCWLTLTSIYGANLADRSDLQDGPLVLEPGPVFAKDGDKNRSEQISYRILRGLNRTTRIHSQYLRCAIKVLVWSWSIRTIFMPWSTMTIFCLFVVWAAAAEGRNCILLNYCPCWSPPTTVPLSVH